MPVPEYKYYNIINILCSYSIVLNVNLHSFHKYIALLLQYCCFCKKKGRFNNNRQRMSFQMYVSNIALLDTICLYYILCQTHTHILIHIHAKQVQGKQQDNERERSGLVTENPNTNKCLQSASLYFSLCG